MLTRSLALGFLVSYGALSTVVALTAYRAFLLERKQKMEFIYVCVDKVTKTEAENKKLKELLNICAEAIQQLVPKHRTLIKEIL